MTSFAIASISFGCVRHLQFIYLTNNYKENFGREDSSARSHTLKSAEKTHLLPPIFAPVAPNPGLDTQKMVHDGFHPMPVMFGLHGAEGLILNPAEDEHPRIPWLGLRPRRSYSSPTKRSAAAEDFLQCSDGFSALLCAGS